MVFTSTKVMKTSLIDSTTLIKDLNDKIEPNDLIYF